MKHAIVLLLTLTMFSCGKRFVAPCKLDNYGIIEFYNRTDTDKTAFVKRFYDNDEMKGDWIVGNVEARTAHIYRLHPGIYSIGLRYPDGREVFLKNANSPRKDKRYSLATCQTLTFNLEYVRVKSKDEGKIRPRRP
jgi:hypothetical protein